MTPQDDPVEPHKPKTQDGLPKNTFKNLQRRYWMAVDWECENSRVKCVIISTLLVCNDFCSFLLNPGHLPNFGLPLVAVKPVRPEHSVIPRLAVGWMKMCESKK